MEAASIPDWIDAVGTLVLAIAAGTWTWLNHKSDRETRARREIESLEGDMGFSAHDYGTGKKLVAIEMTWTNKGPEPVTAKPEGTFIEIHPIPDGMPEGTQIRRGSLPGTGVSRLDPFQGETTLLEPGTASLFRDHVVLAEGRRYLVHWKLQGGNPGDYWTKERVLAL